MEPPSYSEVGEVPSDVLERAYGKLALIQRFVSDGCPRGKLSEYAARAADANGVPPRPYSTLNTWTHRYVRWGVLGLTDGVRADAGQFRSLTPQDEAILELGLIGGQLDLAALVRLLAEYGAPGDAVSYDVVRRWAQAYIAARPALYTAAVEGNGAHRSQHRLALSHPLIRPGKIVAIDSTVADVWIKVHAAASPDAEAPVRQYDAVRPVLSICQDVGSRAVVAFNLSLLPVDSAIITAMFRRVVVEGANHQGLPTLGVPDAVRVDAGSEHASQFRTAIRHLGAELLCTGPDEPEANGSVERVISTCTTECLQNLVGFSQTTRWFDPYRAPESDAKQSARSRTYDTYRAEVLPQYLLTLGQLTERIRAWAVGYNARPHRALTVRSPLIADALAAANDAASSF